jgi:hypothetical protein
LFAIRQYRAEVAAVPSSAAITRIENVSSPTRSSTLIAVRTMSSRLNRVRVGSGSSRNHTDPRAVF